MSAGVNSASRPRPQSAAETALGVRRTTASPLHRICLAVGSQDALNRTEVPSLAACGHALRVQVIDDALQCSPTGSRIDDEARDRRFGWIGFQRLAIARYPLAVRSLPGASEPPPLSRRQCGLRSSPDECSLVLGDRIEHRAHQLRFRRVAIARAIRAADFDVEVGELATEQLRNDRVPCQPIPLRYDEHRRPLDTCRLDDIPKPGPIAQFRRTTHTDVLVDADEVNVVRPGPPFDGIPLGGGPTRLVVRGHPDVPNPKPGPGSAFPAPFGGSCGAGVIHMFSILYGSTETYKPLS